VLSDSDIPVSLDAEIDVEAAATEGPATNQAAGHNPETEPERSVVTAARTENLAIDFAHLKKQLTLARVLDQLGISGTLRGNGEQRRGPCPIHRGDGRGKTFSVHLGDNVFQCFDAKCAKKGDVIDLWASVKGMSLRQAAIDLVHTFTLEPTPPRTEKRNG
jgi:DNA primase